MLQAQSFLTDPLQQFLQKARSLDLGTLADQLMHTQSGPSWSQPTTVRAIARYLGFLYLIDQYPRLQLVSTEEIDCVWHQHSLDFQKYADDCYQLFGRLIYPVPDTAVRRELEPHQWYRSYALTQVLFRQYFDIHLVDSIGIDEDPWRFVHLPCT